MYKSVFNYFLIALITLILILPARFFQTFSLTIFNVESNLSVNYLNGIDVLLAFTSLVIVVKNKGIISFRYGQIVIFFYTLFSLCCSILLIASGNGVYIGEILSKINIVISSLIITNYVLGSFRKGELFCLMYFPLLILVVSTFFLSDYGSYAVSQRAGTLGFGSNEAGTFACALIFLVLFYPKLNALFRVCNLAIGIACVLQTSSRRGILIAAIIFALFFLLWLFKKRKKLKINNVLVFLLFVVAGVFLLWSNYKTIIDYVNGSALFNRLSYLNNVGKNNLYIDDRAKIYLSSFEHLRENFLYGSFGSDLYLAKNSFSHAHNIFLQFLNTHGIIMGGLICIYILCSIKNLFVVIFSKRVHSKSRVIPFVAVLFPYFIGEQFGYLLWNPKGMLLICLSVFALNYYSKLVRAKKECIQNNRSQKTTISNNKIVNKALGY